MEEVYCRFISCGKIKPHLGMLEKFVGILAGVDRCSLSWGSGRGLLEVYLGLADAIFRWGSGRSLFKVYYGLTDSASAGDLEEVY